MVPLLVVTPFVLVATTQCGPYSSLAIPIRPSPSLFIPRHPYSSLAIPIRPSPSLFIPQCPYPPLPSVTAYQVNPSHPASPTQKLINWNPRGTWFSNNFFRHPIAPHSTPSPYHRDFSLHYRENPWQKSPHLYIRQSHSPPYHSPTQPPMVYRIPARRYPYQDHRDGFTSQFTPGGVTIQSPPQWSPPSPEFSTQVDPYSTPALSDCSDVHLPNDLEKSIQVQIDALERAKALIFVRKAQIQIDALEKAKALILARKNGSAGNTQSPALPSPKPPYNVTRNPSAIPITTEYPCPQGPMQPIYPDDLDYPDSCKNVATKDYEPEVIRLNFSKYELPEEFDEPYPHPQGSTQPIYPSNPDYPENLNDPGCCDNITIKDYEPEILRLDFSRYELPEEIEELYQYSREPMQPILMGPDTESRISRDVSDQLATPSEIFAQLRDDQEISMTIAPVEEVNEFLNDFSNDIFEYELESTQSSHITSSSVATTHSMTWYREEPESRNTSPTPQSLAILSPPISTSSSLLSPLPERYLDTSLPLPTPSLLLPPPSLPQSLDQRLRPISRTQSFLQSFVTAASLCSKTPKLPWYSRPQLSGLAVSRENKSFDLGIDAEDPADIANGSGQSQLDSDEQLQPNFYKYCVIKQSYMYKCTV